MARYAVYDTYTDYPDDEVSCTACRRGLPGCTCPEPEPKEQPRCSRCYQYMAQGTTMLQCKKCMEYHAQREANLQKWGLRPQGTNIEIRRGA